MAERIANADNSNVISLKSAPRVRILLSAATAWVGGRQNIIQPDGISADDETPSKILCSLPSIPLRQLWFLQLSVLCFL